MSDPFAPPPESPQHPPGASFPPAAPAYGPPGYPAPGYGPAHGYGYGPPASPGTNGLAIASLVLGIVWIYGVGSVLAIIFGAVALNQIKRTGQSGHGMAVAGLVLGILGVVGVLIVIIAAVSATSGSSGLGALDTVSLSIS